MDRLNQLRGDPNKSRNSSIVDSSLESHEGSGFETANESNGSKYFSFIEDDPSLQDSNLKDVSLVEGGEINDSIGGSSQQLLDSANAVSLLSQLSPVNKSKDSMDNFKIDRHIDAANILSGGVNIFDDNDNSGDENDLVIDDNAMSLENEEDCTSISNNTNEILLQVEKSELIEYEKHQLKHDEKVPKETTNNCSVKQSKTRTSSDEGSADDLTDGVATKDKVHPCHPDRTFHNKSSEDHKVISTYTVKSVDHNEVVDNTTQQTSIRVGSSYVGDTSNLENVKTQNIDQDNMKTAMLQGNFAIQPDVQINVTQEVENHPGKVEASLVLNSKTVSISNVHTESHSSDLIVESTLQNDFSKDIVEVKEPHLEPNEVVVCTQQENTYAANGCNPVNNMFSPTVHQKSDTASTQKDNTTNVVVLKPLQISIVENIMGSITEPYTNAQNIVTSIGLKTDAVNNEVSTALQGNSDAANNAASPASPQNGVENIEIAVSQPISEKLTSIVVSAEVLNADTGDIVLWTERKKVDAGDTEATSSQQNIESRNIVVSTSSINSETDSVKIDEPLNANNISTSTTQQNADPKNIVMHITEPENDIEEDIAVPTTQKEIQGGSPILQKKMDSANLMPHIQNDAKINIVEEPRSKVNNDETVSVVPAALQNTVSENNEKSAAQNEVDPSVQKSDNSTQGEKAIRQNPANEGGVDGVEEPPNVLLQIDGRNVVAVDVGNNLYLYRKETDDEVTAIQIVPVENEQPQCKFLNVRHNEEGNFEVYEEHSMDSPPNTDQNNEAESTKKLESHGIFKSNDVKNLETKPFHLPKKDLNKVINVKEVSNPAKSVVCDASSSAIQPDNPATSQGPTEDYTSVPKIAEDKIKFIDLSQQHKVIEKTNKEIKDALPGPSGIPRESFRNAENPIFSSTPKAKLTIKKEITKTDVGISATASFVKPIPNLLKMNETSSSCKNPLVKPQTLPKIMGASLGVKSQNVKRDEKLQQPRSNNSGLMIPVICNPDLKQSHTDPERKQNHNVKPGELLDRKKVSNMQLVEPSDYNVKHITVPISQNPNFKSYKFSQHPNLKSSKPVEKSKISKLKPDSQQDELPNYNLIPPAPGEQHDSDIESRKLLEKQHTANIKPHSPLDKSPNYNLKPLVPLEKSRQSIKYSGSLETPIIKPYVPLAKPRKGNLKTLRPVEKSQNAILKSGDLRTPSEKPYVFLGKKSNPNTKHVGELCKLQSINFKGHAAVDRPQNFNLKRHLPSETPKTARMSMQFVSQIKPHNPQVELCATNNSQLEKSGHKKTLRNMSTMDANNPGPFRFVIEPSKKKEVTLSMHQKTQFEASIAPQLSGTPIGVNLDNNVYNDTYISEALNVKIQPDTGKDTQDFAWGRNQIRNIPKKDKESIKTYLPKKSFNVDHNNFRPLKSTDNILMDAVSVSVSVFPVQGTSCDSSIINNRNSLMHTTSKETVQNQGSDTTVTAVSVLPPSSKSHLTNKNCEDEKTADVVTVNLSESSIDGYSEEEISECRPVTGDIDWEAREKALTDKRDSEYIENVLHTIEESISKMEEDKPQPSSGAANTILLNTALHNVRSDTKSVITETEFDKFVRRNSRHAPEDRITLQLPVNDVASANTSHSPSDTKSNVNLDKSSIARIPKSNIIPNNVTGTPTKVYPTKTVPPTTSISKYERVTSKRNISSESYNQNSGKHKVVSTHPSSYLAGVQKVNESSKFKRAYQSELEKLQTRGNAKPIGASNISINDKPVTVVILDPDPAAIVHNNTGLTLKARSSSPLVTVHSPNVRLNSVAHSASPLVALESASVVDNSRTISSAITSKRVVSEHNLPVGTASPKLAIDGAIVNSDSIALGATSMVVVDNAATATSTDEATTSPSSSESVHNSATEEKSFFSTQKSKYKHPRKQVLTSVERQDMEIVFPNLHELHTNEQVYLPAKGRKRKGEDPSHADETKRFSPLTYKEACKKTVSSKRKLNSKESLSEFIKTDCNSESSISNPANTISEKPVAPAKDEVNRDLSKCLTRHYKNKDGVEEYEPTTGRNTVKDEEKTGDIRKRRDMPESMGFGKEVDEIYQLKKGRGRPRKSIVPILTSSEKIKPNNSAGGETPQTITKDLVPSTPRPRRYSLHSNEDYSSDDDQVLVNWSMGKIDEKIVCPICSKLFRSENVVFKHVKHCTGPDKVVSPDKKTSSSSQSLAEEEPPSTPTPSKRGRGRPRNKQMSKDTNVNEAEGFAETSISHKDGENELNSSSVVILDSSCSTNVIITDTLGTVTKMNEKSDHDDSKHGKIKNKNKKSYPLTPLTRLAKVMKVPVRKNPSYSCETCGKSFRQLSYLANHRRAHHQSQKRPSTEYLVPAPPVALETSALSCEVCKKGFRKLHHLVQHREIHKGPAIPPSREDPNGKTTESRTVVPTVVTVQEGSKLAPATGFRCEACDKSFRKLYHLVEHRETHDSRARLSAPPAAPLMSAKPRASSLESANPCAAPSVSTDPHSAPLVPHTTPLVLHTTPLASDAAPLVPQTPPLTTDATHFVLCAVSSVPKAVSLIPRTGHSIPTVVLRHSSSDSLITAAVPNCGICGKSFRKLHHLIEHRESHMVSKDVPEMTIETTDPNVKPTMLAKDIIHECSHCYMVFPNEPSLNKHLTLCQRKKKSQSSTHSTDPTIDAATQDCECDNEPIIFFSEDLTASIPPTRLSTTSPVQMETNIKNDCQQSGIENEKTLVDTKVPANISTASPTLSKEDSVESDDSEIIFNTSKSVDSETRYMINPLFENGSKQIATKRASIQGDVITNRLNQLHHNVSRRTSVPSKLADWKTNQHSPPKKSKRMASQCLIKNTASKKNSKPEVQPRNNKKSEALMEEDDHNLLYSFPNRRTSTRTASTSHTSKETSSDTNKITMPTVKKSLRSTSKKTSSLKINTEKSSEKRKSLAGIAKRKNDMLQETVSKAKMRPCCYNFTDRAELTEHKNHYRKRPAPLQHLCDCGELFSSATLLAQHTSLAHTPPRIRRPRDPPPPALDLVRPARRASRPAAHHGVPIPNNMRKAVTGIKL